MKLHFLWIKIRDLARAKLLHYSVIEGKENNLFIECWAKRFLDELETTWDCLKSHKCSASEKVIMSRCEALQERNSSSYIVARKKAQIKWFLIAALDAVPTRIYWVFTNYYCHRRTQHVHMFRVLLAQLSTLVFSFFFFFVCKQFSALSSLLVVFTLFFLGKKLWTLVNNKICAVRYQRWKWKKFSSCLFIVRLHPHTFVLMPSKTINDPDHVTSQQRTTIYRRRKLFRNFNYAQMGPSRALQLSSDLMKNVSRFSRHHRVWLARLPVGRSRAPWGALVAEKIGRRGGVGGENAISSGAFDLWRCCQGE